MLKAFGRLVNDDAEVSVDTGLPAAEKVQSVLDKRDQGDDIAEMRLQFHRILDAVKSTVPEEYRADIVEKLDQQQHPEALDAEAEEFDDEDPYDPTGFAEDEDDEF